MRISDWSSDVCSSDLAAYGSGYASGVWGTYRQWQALGAQVRKGEHASLGVLWKELRAKGDEGSDDEDGDHRRLFAKAFSLFNADQVDGSAPEPGPVLPDSERLAAAEAFIAALGIATVYGSASAHYPLHLKGLVSGTSVDGQFKP